MSPLRAILLSLLLAPFTALSQDGWYIVTNPTTEDLHDIHTDVGGRRWALGDNGTLLLSTDIGETWSVISSGTTADLQTIYDLLGREVISLVNQTQPAGSYEVSWDATGQVSGVYFYRLTAENFVETRKLVLLR